MNHVFLLASQKLYCEYDVPKQVLMFTNIDRDGKPLVELNVGNLIKT